MKSRKDYSKSPAPRYDALQDLIEILGDRWSKCNEHLKGVTDTDQFENWASFAGVEGVYPEVWYDHIHGEGEWRKHTGSTRFEDGGNLKPDHTRRVFASAMIEDLVKTLTALSENRSQDHILSDLSTDDFRSVEEWVQDWLEKANEDLDNKIEEELAWDRFVTKVKGRLIESMVQEVLRAREKLLKSIYPDNAMLDRFNSDELFRLVDFLNSFKPRED